MSQPFVTHVHVYLEDTDAQGIVYHANYLKFFERARTDWLAARGSSLRQAQENGQRFVVHELHIKYARPALLNDELVISTETVRASPYRLSFSHRAQRRDEAQVLVSAEVQVVCIGRNNELCEVDPALVG